MLRAFPPRDKPVRRCAISCCAIQDHVGARRVEVPVHICPAPQAAAQGDGTAMVAVREALHAAKADAFGQLPGRQRTMQERAGALFAVRQFLPPAARRADKKLNRRAVVHGSLVPAMEGGGNESTATAAPPRNPPSGHVQSAGRSPGLRMVAGDPAFPASRASGAMDPLSGYGRGGGCIGVADPFAFPFHLHVRAGTSTWRHFDESRSQVKQGSPRLWEPVRLGRPRLDVPKLLGKCDEQPPFGLRKRRLRIPNLPCPDVARGRMLMTGAYRSGSSLAHARPVLDPHVQPRPWDIWA